MVDGVTTSYTLDLNNPLTQVLADGANTYLYGTARIAQYDASGAQYFLADSLGSVKQLADSAGGVQLSKTYEPFGEVLDGTGNAASSYGFTGEWTDAYNKLIYLRARWYSPQIGRFTSIDPWRGNYSKPMSLNPWMYFYNNPTNLTDPTGMIPTKDEIRRGRHVYSCNCGWIDFGHANPARPKQILNLFDAKPNFGC